MSSEVRLARVRALAKINLSLKVLGKRPDGYHELRTIFQTISLGDELEVRFEPGRRTRFELESSLDIPDNLVLKAARLVMRAMAVKGRVQFRLRKRIPMRGGMGGGSSDAAAVLLALPVLAGKALPQAKLTELAAKLGSDVPFFLLGGTALGLGRGEELHPLPEAGPLRGLAVFPGVEVPTPAAYQALKRELTDRLGPYKMNSFQTLTRSLGDGLTVEGWAAASENDFEPYALNRYPQIARARRKLLRLGGQPVMMCGSGSSLFGIFEDRRMLEQARLSFRDVATETFALVSRARYRRMWWRSLQGHLRGETWPPRSRYV
ncbi:MAG: 4-(cytidine 5'-diphospho)-2-C-methyl-D-erythritol kinase [bacterium]|nr:4-(cytidine 5'-diphospho)-2-C-methyl-D-erythritol kinase [bacterium]